jgi:hypothetical protein
LFVSFLFALVCLCALAAGQQRPFFKPVPKPLAIKHITTNAEEGSKKRTGSKEAPFSVEDLMDASLFPEPIPGTVFVLSGGLYRLGQLLTCVSKKKRKKTDFFLLSPLVDIDLFHTRSFSDKLNGNDSNPVVIMANPGDRVTFEGKISINGNYIWLIGKDLNRNVYYR